MTEKPSRPFKISFDERLGGFALAEIGGGKAQEGLVVSNQV